MRKIKVAAFVSIDGVLQAPGGPEEDKTGGFAHGGWVAGYGDEEFGAAIGELFSVPYELLLGRKTYDIFAAYWPYFTDQSSPDYKIAEEFNRIAKHVVTHRGDSLTWNNSHALGADPVAALRALKQSDGPALLTQGSSEVVHLLLANQLVDELHVMTFPIVLGRGKRLFANDAAAIGFALQKSQTTSNGIVLASYTVAGDVKTGSFVDDKPSAAELERRRTWQK